jgi:hypothetical protein
MEYVDLKYTKEQIKKLDEFRKEEIKKLKSKGLLELFRLKEMTGDRMMLEIINTAIEEKLELPQPQSVKYRDNKNRKRITYI